jgi:hypothetical protein
MVWFQSENPFAQRDLPIAFVAAAINLLGIKIPGLALHDAFPFPQRQFRNCRPDRLGDVRKRLVPIDPFRNGNPGLWHRLKLAEDQSAPIHRPQDYWNYARFAGFVPLHRAFHFDFVAISEAMKSARPTAE